MKHSRNILTFLVLLLAGALAGRAQESITLQFTGQDQNGQYVPLSGVLVENVSKHWQEMLYYPDTTLFVGQTGIEEIEQLSGGMRLFQNVPNPFDGITDFVLYLPEASKVLLEIYNLNGKLVADYSGSLEQGNHQFRAWLDAPQTHLLKSSSKDGTLQIKMVNMGSAGQNRIDYLGKAGTLDVAKSDKGSTNQPFSPGDIFLYKGFVQMADVEYESAHVLQEQFDSAFYYVGQLMGILKEYFI